MTAAVRIDAAFRDRVVRVTGEAGAAWADSLPGLLGRVAERWGLTVEAPFEPLSYNYVAPAVRADGLHVVLKALLPETVRQTEPAVLGLADGQGMVRMLEHDAGAGVMLLERVEPGRPLLELADDEEATRIAARIMQRYWREPPERHPFPTVAEWLRAFDKHRAEYGGSGPLRQGLFERAETTAAELLASSAPAVVLHGDLHHWNILSATREPWLAIDPQGVVGEPAFEVGAWLRNPMPDTRETPVLARRIAILAEELHIDRERVAAWGAVNAVLSAAWSAENGGTNWGPAMLAAERLFGLV